MEPVAELCRPGAACQLRAQKTLSLSRPAQGRCRWVCRCIPSCYGFALEKVKRKPLTEPRQTFALCFSLFFLENSLRVSPIFMQTSRYLLERSLTRGELESGRSF